MGVNMFEQLGNDSRAVSEVLGYALSFSVIILVSIVVVTSAGPIIDSAESENAEIPVENTFVHLSQGVYDVQDGSDRRVMERHMPGGQVNPGETTVVFESNGEEFVIGTRSLEFITENGDAIIYDSGFVAVNVNNELDESTDIRYSPVESFEREGTMIRIPSINIDSEQDITGSTSASLYRFEIEQLNSEQTARTHTFDEEPVQVEVTTDVPSAWSTYLNEHERFVNVQRDDDVVFADVVLENELTVVSQEMGMEISTT